MRTEQEIQARISEIEGQLPKTHPSHRDKLRVEIFTLEYVLGWSKFTAQERVKAHIADRNGRRNGVPKIVRLAKQTA